jgi:hypothetical protein
MRIFVPSFLHHQSLLGWATYKLEEKKPFVTFDTCFDVLLAKVELNVCRNRTQYISLLKNGPLQQLVRLNVTHLKVAAAHRRQEE